LMVFAGSSPITTTSPSSKAHQKSGPFPQPALPGFNGHTTPSDSNQQTVTLPPELTKNNREHTFPVGPMASAIIHRRVQLERDSRLLFQAQGSERPFSGWSKCKKALDKVANIAPWTLHDLRRTFRTNLGRLKVRPISRSGWSITFPLVRKWRRPMISTRTHPKCVKRWRNGRRFCKPFALTSRLFWRRNANRLHLNPQRAYAFPSAQVMFNEERLRIVWLAKPLRAHLLEPSQDIRVSGRL
jgi:hypothetical protein